MRVKHSTVFITGASRGIGLAFAREALARGAAKVYAGVRHPDAFTEIGIVPVRLDVTEIHSVAEAVRRAPGVTLLINNAGIAEVCDHPFADDIEEQSRQLFETNYYGVIRMIQAFAPTLPGQGAGAIINVLSDATWKPIPILTPYAATKAAAWSYTNAVRLHLRDRGVQVLGPHVGFVDTDLTKGVDAPKSDAVDVVRWTLDALEAGESEVMADEGTRALKRSLSAKEPGYIDPLVFG